MRRPPLSSRRSIRRHPFEVLLDAIGAGSMGQVYRASSKNDNNLYAVKVLPRRM
jgi:predicted unusual protein kinase regulating ubiquinone biosynthesis (AarF/ABC1/UbiB family)